MLGYEDPRTTPKIRSLRFGRAALPKHNVSSSRKPPLRFSLFRQHLRSVLIRPFVPSDLSTGTFGVGLDVPLVVSLYDGSFRNEEFPDGVGPLRLRRSLPLGRTKGPGVRESGQSVGGIL